ncbi:helix-turn-helix domain-containing protein [Streptomyces tsukubensis]|uniref:Transcriptional regulator n=2 Tax=Streptomyces tsukubensis TaxID=83656 RepID=A0A1V4ACI2_9ACTN|nr:helix-turn-helix transcriptional regulator [Streptomyces tsukubensis]OON81394.1 transcriptional regulator [Streptomyces tsukubensis]QFR97982.1 helix-turn-helix domain-containing protein [Streptomyces tsukubensis]
MAWRYCGNQIKLWRTEAGGTREELASEANYDSEYVKSMEQGRRKPTVRLLRVADQLYGAKGKLEAGFDYLKPEPFPARTQQYMHAEAEALAIDWYEPLLIPGLLQNEQYAFALIGDSCPPLDDETVNERVEARLKRQALMIERASVAYGFMIYEAALRTGVGGKDVMKNQLNHLLALNELRNVTIQVVPEGRCNGLALMGSIVLLETPDHDRYAYSEVQTTSLLYADRAKVSELSQRHGMIQKHALTVGDSTECIRKVAEEL